MYILYMCLEVSGRVSLGWKGRAVNRDRSTHFDGLNRNELQILGVSNSTTVLSIYEARAGITEGWE